MSKYYKKKTHDNVYDSLGQFFDDGLHDFMKQFDSNKWRTEKLWTEPCDKVMRYYEDDLRNVFKEYSGKYSTPGNLKDMSIEEFINLMTDSGFVSEDFGNREIGIVWN